MKVLMLGWEFPPHITGGLATACLGLCEGLKAAGVEVTFVVPRAVGDEDARFARVVGANQVWIERAPPAPAVAQPATLSDAPHAARRSEVRTPTAVKVRREPAREPIRFVAPEPVVAPLSAYFSAEQYEQWLSALSELHDLAVQQAREQREQEALAREALSEPEVLDAAAVESLESEGADSEPTRDAQAAAATPARAPWEPRHERYEFRGDYGADLFAEVERYARCVDQLSASEHFDLVHAHDWMTFPAGALAARRLGVPLVVHVHACEYDRSGDNVDERIRRMEQAGVDSAARVVCVSHYTAGILRDRYGVDEARLRVVHNAVTRKEQRERLRAVKNFAEPIVLFLGRVTFQKGPDYFLEAAKRVVEVEPNVKFVMVGAGDMLPKMVERAARMGLARHVHFTGFLKGPDVERIYSMADVYVMPSVSEPFGISPLEALALDTPVIVSRQSGVAEVLSNALKADFWDVEEIANKILALLRYPALREHVLAAGGDEVRAMSWTDRGKRLRDVYAELVR